MLQNKRTTEQETGGQRGRRAAAWAPRREGSKGVDAADIWKERAPGSRSKGPGTPEEERDSQRGECQGEERKEENRMVRAQAIPLDSILSNMGKVWKVLTTGGKQQDLHFQRSLSCWGKADWRGRRWKDTAVCG